jgi:hypothetical protein
MGRVSETFPTFPTFPTPLQNRLWFTIVVLGSSYVRRGSNHAEARRTRRTTFAAPRLSNHAEGAEDYPLRICDSATPRLRVNGLREEHIVGPNRISNDNAPQHGWLRDTD